MIEREIVNQIVEKREYFEQKILEFLLCDTMLFCSENEEINSLYGKQISKVIDDFNKMLGVDYKLSRGFDVDDGNKTHQDVVGKYLSQTKGDFLSCIYMIATELRSVMLAVLLMNKKISVDESVELAFYEENFQQKQWGNIQELADKNNQIRHNINKILE